MQELERSARYDALTGLSNRSSIVEHIQRALNGDSRDRTAVLFLDFDRFKLVNDSLGHDVGDELLKLISGRLQVALGADDVLIADSTHTVAARLGGDEFVILLEGLTNTEDAPRFANRLLDSLAQPYNLDGHDVVSTASIGVVNSIRTYCSPSDVLRDADAAMYAAKLAGKGQVVVFDQKMRSAAKQRLLMENALRAAIANEDLALHYQPIVSLNTGQVQAVEALVRWQDTRRGMIGPQEFLPIADESGLIIPLGEWVLDRACADFSHWQQTLGSRAPTSVHVNMSRRHLQTRGFLSSVWETLAKYNMPHERLHLEITESEIMEDIGLARDILQDLRQAGVKVDMDDFGTGHSSLACLRDLPIDVLKIDRSFVANIEKSRSFAALIHAVTALGQNLGLTTIAEGIETVEQVAMLQAMDCDFGQGYFFGKPMSAADATALFSDEFDHVAQCYRPSHATSQLPEQSCTSIEQPPLQPQCHE